MSGVILYQSKYGATKRYAEWLSEETGFDCTETRKASIDEIATYDTVVLGGGLYASGIAGLSFLRKNAPRLVGKRVAVFCCGASPYEERAFQQVKERNMKGALSDVPLFYCRGAWDYEAMSLKDRLLCDLLRAAVAKKDPSDYEPWEKALMDAGKGTCDWTDRKSIRAIVDWADR